MNPSALAAAAAAAVAGAALYALYASKKRRVTPGGPLYAKAQAHNGVVYVSGQVAALPNTKPPKLVSGGIVAETRQCLENLKQALAESNSSLDRVLKTTCYLSTIDDYAAFNGVYLEYFANEVTRPARVCFGPGGLPLGALVEIDAIAMC